MPTATQTHAANTPDTALAHDQFLEAMRHLTYCIEWTRDERPWRTGLAIGSALEALDSLNAALRSLGEDPSRCAITLIPPANARDTQPAPSPEAESA